MHPKLLEGTTMLLVLLICAFPILCFAIKVYIKLKRSSWKRRHKNKISVGFFHPYCSAGGGGERVLWCAVRSIQKRYKNAHCAIYTGDATPGREILEKAKKCFDIELPDSVEFIHLKSRHLVEARHYRYFTLLCQSLASIVLGFEAALRHVPEIYIDTMGYAWTYPIFRYVCSSRIGAYVHYPTISTDMLSSVSEKKVTVNNREFISKSVFLSRLKLYYYRMFALLYSQMGRRAQVIMVNSSWTQNHILELWNKPESTFRVYPPCDTSAFETLPVKSGLDAERLRIVSVAQFRPEKNHALQLRAIKAFLDKLPSVKDRVTLVLVGSCRHEEDFERVRHLTLLCVELGIEKNVEFKVNLSFEEVVREMTRADIALHSMWNEHFGIGIVECMSAGLITIAHASGGPKLDIIEDGKTGFLASDAGGYATALESVFNMRPEELLTMRREARQSMTRFSVENFEKTFLAAVHLLFGEM